MGLKCGGGAPLLTHLLFVDDCFLFCWGKESEAKFLYDGLKAYEEAPS